MGKSSRHRPTQFGPRTWRREWGVQMDCGHFWFIFTSGHHGPDRICTDFRHALEVEGAAMALLSRDDGWRGRTRMDCGCTLIVCCAEHGVPEPTRSEAEGRQ